MPHRDRFPASSQTSSASSPTSQVSKTWEVGRGLADQLDPFVRDVEHKDPPVEFLGDYVQRVEDRIAGAAGVKPNEIRITWGNKWYGFLVPDRRLYLSVGLLGRVSSEGELAGLLSHELAHANPKLGVEFEQCALAAGYLPVQRNPRTSEGLAMQRAIGYMKASGFDPSAMLDVFSKISYENQRWSKAIVDGGFAKTASGFRGAARTHRWICNRQLGIRQVPCEVACGGGASGFHDFEKAAESMKVV